MFWVGFAELNWAGIARIVKSGNTAGNTVRTAARTTSLDMSRNNTAEPSGN